jgi:hypothetical protein
MIPDGEDQQQKLGKAEDDHDLDSRNVAADDSDPEYEPLELDSSEVDDSSDFEIQHERKTPLLRTRRSRKTKTKYSKSVITESDKESNETDASEECLTKPSTVEKQKTTADCPYCHKHFIGIWAKNTLARHVL